MQRKQLKQAISDSYNKTLLNLAATPQPLNFPKSFIAFSKSKQDVCLRLVLAMNGQQEPVRYKSNEGFESESNSVSVSLNYL